MRLDLTMHSRAVCSLLVLTSVAEAAPRTLTSTYQESETMHMADQRGANNRHTDVTVTITLADKGKLAVTAVGKDNDHWLDAIRGENTDVDTAWTTTWSGTWKETADTLTLSLVLDGQKCTKEETSDRFAAKKLRCDAPSKRARIVCESETVEVGNPNAREPAWRCSKQQGELGETYPYWVVGKNTCIKTHGGRHSRSYAPC